MNICEMSIKRAKFLNKFHFKKHVVIQTCYCLHFQIELKPNMMFETNTSKKK